MRRTMIERTMLLVLAGLLCCGLSASAVRVVPASIDEPQAPGSTETYILTIFNDTEARETLRLYVGDWQRLENGEHDWEVPLNGARWIFSDDFASGEERVVRYAVQTAGELELAVSGSYRTSSPQLTGETDGVKAISVGAIGTPNGVVGDGLSIERVVQGVEDGVATVALHIRAEASFTGLTVYEVYEKGVQIADVDAQGARFDTVNRSNADGVVLSHERLTIEPGESREVLVTVTTPEGIDGVTWSAVFVETEPRIVDQGGTRVLSIYRTAIKVMLTAPGTERPSGEISMVRTVGGDPLAIQTAFVNTGNVRLAVEGSIDIIDRTGTVIRELDVGEFKVLPGAMRVIATKDKEDVDPLEPGVYQAVVSLDFGSENPIVGVRGFRIR